MSNIKKLLPILVLIIFIAAIWVMHKALAEFHYHQIIGYIRAVPMRDRILAILLTAANYLLLTGYDQLAIRYLQTPLERSRIMLASFISYAFSSNIGLSLLTAGSLRYRFYSSWGLSAEQITKLIGFTVITFWLGLIGAGGLVLTFQPLSLNAISWLPNSAAFTLGPFFLLLVACYLFFFCFRKNTLHLGSWEFSSPKPGIGIAQIVIGSLDWCLAGAVLYVLLPDTIPLSLGQMLGIYLLAQIVALISHVPGGLGVFESMILLLAPQVSSAALLGSLMLYRVIYYLMPLALATAMLAAVEMLQRKHQLGRLSQSISQWSSGVTPQLLALTTLISGTILLFSGATPAVGHRLHWLGEFMPLEMIELSHFLASLVGAVLLLLARGLQRRLDGAYIVTVILLAVGSILSLTKGGDYEEAITLLLILAALLPCRRFFYRKSSLFTEPFSLQWVMTIVIIFSCSLFLGFFANKHVAYSGELWWQFAFHADASRFLRAGVGSGVILLLFSIARLLRTVPPTPEMPDKEALLKAKTLINKSPSTEANLALLGDKALFFDENDQGFIMYGIQGHSWITMGDPVAPPSVAGDLAWKFREMVERHGGSPIFYEVGPDMLHLYLDMGLSLYKLGEEAKVSLSDFTMTGKKRSGLRYTLSKLDKAGCEFEIIPASDTAEIMNRLKLISDSWLHVKNSREKGFSLGFFDPEYLSHFPIAVVRLDGEIIAFANIWTTADKEELSIDLMRYLPETPSGIMEYLFIQLILWGKEQGYHYFSLGMAPLAGLENRPFAPLWHRVGAIVFRHGEHFYNFEGLRQYKEKFSPVWEPRYLACKGGLALPKLLTDTATLIAGGIRGIFGK